MLDEAVVIRRMGEDGIGRLVGAFYRRVREDAAAGGPVGSLYPPGDWEGAEQRLREFLVYRFGGSKAYVEKRGHPRMRMRHLPFAIGPRERDRWLEMMGEAMKETEVDEACAGVLWPFFVQVAEHMRNRE